MGYQPRKITPRKPIQTDPQSSTIEAEADARRKKKKASIASRLPLSTIEMSRG